MPQNNTIHILHCRVPQWNFDGPPARERVYVEAEYVDADYVE